MLASFQKYSTELKDHKTQGIENTGNAGETYFCFLFTSLLSKNKHFEKGRKGKRAVLKLEVTFLKTRL